MVRVPGVDDRGAIWGGRFTTCRDTLIPGQYEYDRSEMAKHLGEHGVLHTVENPTVKDFPVSSNDLYTGEELTGISHRRESI